jgi:acid phosphatase type 7
MFKKKANLSLILVVLSFISASLFAENVQKAVIFGDSRTNIEVYREVTEKVVQHQPQAVFHTGDMVANGMNEAQWKEFTEATAKIKKIALFFPVCGNHEANAQAFLDHSPGIGSKPWYATDQVGLHWIIVDSELPLKKGSEQISWLEKELKHNKDKFCVLLLHHPVYSSGMHAHELNSADIRALIEKYKVKLVFSGHDHFYERSFHEGTDYIVTGGAGAPLRNKVYDNPYSQIFSSTYHYCVLENHLDSVHIDVFDLQDNKIDSLTITK